MNKEKDPLMNKKIYQGKIFKLLMCFTITFLIINSMSFYKGIEGQKINSSDLIPNSSTTIKNMSLLPLKNTNHTLVNSSKDYSNSLPDLFDHFKKSVVQITDSADLKQQDGLGISRLGSGFVYDSNGDIVTNYHVVAGAKNNTIVVTFLDGVSYEAGIKGVDPYSDLAVVKLLNLDKHTDALSKLIPLPIANSSSLRVGQTVVAVGNPFGLSGTLTEGIISGLGRLMPTGGTDQLNPPLSPPSLQFKNPFTPTVPNQTFSIPDVIQTDAAINPGNSGGPLLNMKGQVIGINTAIYSDTGANAGIGFAIPSNFIIKIVPTLVNGGTYKHPYLGISGFDITPAIAKLLNLSKSTGYLVVNVTKNSPAFLDGVKGGNTTYHIDGVPVQLGGDIIIKIDNNDVRKVNDVLSYLENYKKVGDKVSLTVLRGGNETKVIPITLGARPEINSTYASSPPTLGIIGLDLNPDLASLLNTTQTSGFLITGVLDKSPASKSDLRGGYIVSEINGKQIPIGGDIIITIDKHDIKNQQDIKRYLSTKKVGDTIAITVIRDGKQLTKSVTLTNFTANPSILNNNNGNNFLNQNPLPNSPPSTPNQNFNDFLNSCYKILDKSICDSLIPNQ
jgi:serine protease Do